jgi:hypothetical protein
MRLFESVEMKGMYKRVYKRERKLLRKYARKLESGSKRSRTDDLMRQLESLTGQKVKLHGSARISEKLLPPAPEALIKAMALATLDEDKPVRDDTAVLSGSGASRTLLFWKVKEREDTFQVNHDIVDGVPVVEKEDGLYLDVSELRSSRGGGSTFRERADVDRFYETFRHGGLTEGIQVNVKAIRDAQKSGELVKIEM